MITSQCIATVLLLYASYAVLAHCGCACTEVICHCCQMHRKVVDCCVRSNNYVLMCCTYIHGKQAVGQIKSDNLNEIRSLKMPPEPIADVLGKTLHTV
jgi:hypothetical protein